ncbi:type II toxin-antitoxin system RelE/ParE family toxin [Pontibacter saemangeumensis]
MHELEAFCKRPKHGYSSCKQDIVNEFGGLDDINSFFNKPELITINGDTRLNKTRIANSGQNIGKSGGFRVLYIVNRATEEVTFLHIYAKKGSNGKANVTGTELKRLLKNYIDAKRQNSLSLISEEKDLLKVLK